MKPWLDQILDRLPGVKTKANTMKALAAVWDSLSDEAKLEIANAAMKTVKKVTDNE